MGHNRLVPKTGGNCKCTARTEIVVTYIEFCKNQRPSPFSKEIQRDLVNNRVCLPQNVPSRASIMRSLWEDRLFIQEVA